MQLPQMIRVKQTFESPRVSSIPDEVASQLGSLSLDQSIQPGQTVAISAGSRGIANIAEIIKAACDHVKTLGAHPVIIPAMGSDQAPHEFRRRHRIRPAQDDADRPGQARGRQDLPPRDPGLQLARDRHGRRRERTREVQRRGWTGDRRKCVRRNGGDRGCTTERVFRTREGPAAASQGVDAEIAVRRGRPADRGRDRQERQRIRYGHQCHRPQIQRSLGHRQRRSAGSPDLRPRIDQ